MKKLSLLMLASVICFSSFSQQSFNDSIAFTRNYTTQKAMIVLGGWAAANIATGFIIAGQAHGEAQYFWRMNAYWNLINEGLVIMGYLGARQAMQKKIRTCGIEAAQMSIEKLYAFNFGLDLAYIATGFFLREKGINSTSLKSQDQLKGYGSSIAVQGGFLLVMDGFMIWIHHKNSSRLNKKLKGFDLAATPNGVGLVYTF